MSRSCEHVLDTLTDLTISRAVRSRRAALKGSAAGIAALAVSSFPLGLALAADRALAQTGGGATAALQLALKLEYLESAFYAAGIARFGLGVGDVTDTEQQFLPPEDAVIAAIAAHEAAHVTLLTTALGSAAPAPATYDFSGGSGAGTGPFVNAIGTADTASKDDFFKLAQLFEDLGVRAYKGQLAKLVNDAHAGTALRIHSVEARHAAEIRVLRNVGVTDGSVPYFDTTDPWPAYGATTADLYDSNFSTDVGENGKAQADYAALVYGPATPRVQGVQAPSSGEDNVVQVSSQATTTLPGYSPYAEAFDEPMSASAVMTIAGFFGVA